MQFLIANFRPKRNEPPVPPPEAFALLRKFPLQDHQDDKSKVVDGKDLINISTAKPQILKNKMTSIDSDIRFRKSLKPGDHVYTWQSFGIPFAYQRHGIILSVSPDRSGIIVVTFTSPAQSQKFEDIQYISDAKNLSRRFKEKTSSFVVRKMSLEEFAKGSKVHKVQYSATTLRCLFQRAGTVTPVHQDPSQIVLARVHYLLQNPDVLPAYDMLTSNCECVSVWCCTGNYITLQAFSILHHLSFQVQGAAIVTIAVKNPLCGLTALVTSNAPLLAGFTMLIPCLIAYGAVSFLPLKMLKRCIVEWDKISEELNQSLWESVRKQMKNSSTKRRLNSKNKIVRESKYLKNDDDVKTNGFVKVWKCKLEKIQRKFYMSLKMEVEKPDVCCKSLEIPEINRQVKCIG